MATPRFEEFSLQNDSYITESVNYRTTPPRTIDTRKISRRPGVKLLSEDFVERRVSLAGSIIGSGIADLQSKIDDFHAHITRKDSGLLVIDDDRTGTAVPLTVSIADPHYAQDFVPFEIEFLMTDPFWYSAQQRIVWNVGAGTSSQSYSITISGSVFSEPSITYEAPAGGGQTTTSGVIVEYSPTSETVTWSGTGVTPTLAYGGAVTFDYAHHSILEDTEEVDIKGVFSRWEPGATAFSVTYSGTAAGGTLEFAYQPRYL